MQNSSSFVVYNASAGSGKTFTIVKEYLKIILRSSNVFKYQQILALTFTNKAAGEMKERIIKSLNDFSNAKETDLFLMVSEELSVDKNSLVERSKIVLNTILQNYSSFHISTIDSFNYRLIKTFAFDLGLSVSADVTLDAESLLNEAIDLILSKIGEDEKLTRLLVEYSFEKLDDDKSWDISKDLFEFSKMILNENHIEKIQLLKEISITTFTNIKNDLIKKNRIIEKKFVEIGEKGLKLIDEIGVEYSFYAQNGELPKHFLKLKNFRTLKTEDLKFEGRLNKTIEENKNLYSGKCSSYEEQQITTSKDELQQFYFLSKEIYDQFFSEYILNKLIIKSLVPLAVLSYINNALQEIKEENDLLLNAEFNNIISQTIKNEPAPFIYERLGEKFNYYFVDEMQDTSELQWNNLIPLIENAIASENEEESGKLFLVGDAKQSIYRWRGSKAEQFMALSSPQSLQKTNPFFVEKNVTTLENNFRSFYEVVQFNNAFFSHIASFLSNDDYKQLYELGNQQIPSKKSGGYVQISFLEKDKEDEDRNLVFAKKVHQVITDLNDQYDKNEICILTRTRIQGIEVANYLNKNNVEVISSETLQINNSLKVQFIINFLKIVVDSHNEEVKIQTLYFLYDFINSKVDKHEFLNSLIHLNETQFYQKLEELGIKFEINEFHQFSLYDAVEYLINAFNLTESSDAYIQFFLDEVFDFQHKKGSSLINFLEYWDEKGVKANIVASESKNAVRIITIHKAKGLEFPVIIYPYDTDIYFQKNTKLWYYYDNEDLQNVLINGSKELTFTGNQGTDLVNLNTSKIELDGLNVLYVALTRAIEQLYIITEKRKPSKSNSKPRYTSDLLKSFLISRGLENNENDEYSFGSKERICSREEVETHYELQNKFLSNNWSASNIKIVANSKLHWEKDKSEAIKYGNLLHELMAKIKTESDLEEVLNQYSFSGIISEEESNVLNKTVQKIITHPKLKEYFDHNLEVINERSFINQSKNIEIPDRVVLKNNKAIIIDYKTGIKDIKHIRQISNYAETLSKIGFKVDKKLLVYISDKILVEEV